MITAVPDALISRSSWKMPRAGAVVEVAGRLVGDEDERVVHERARERHALLLAAGELLGIRRRLRRQADLRRARGDAVRDRSAAARR